jgi:hypothetical protein
MNWRLERRFRIDGRGAVATVLGGDELRVPCRIVNVSRSGMRIALAQPVPETACMQVDWGRNFLVGNVRYVREENGDHIIGLQLLTCSYWSGAANAGVGLIRLGWMVDAGAEALARALRRILISAVGARTRPAQPHENPLDQLAR